MPESKPFAVYAQRTIKLLEDEGWQQEQYGPCAHDIRGHYGHGPHCFIGAIAELHLPFDREMAFITALSAKLPPTGQTSVRSSLVVWNDHSERTQADVIEVLQQFV